MDEEKTYTPALNESQDSIENRICATYRAIAKEKDVKISFGANNQATNLEKNIRLPNMKNTSKNGLDVARGEADFSAFKYRFHDEKIHRQNRPSDENHAMLFNALEDARIEAMGSNLYKGASKNIDKALDNRYEKMDIATSAVHLGENGWAETVRLLARQKFSDKTPPKCTQALLELHSKKNTKKLQSALDELSKCIDNQQEFAKTVKKILKALDNDSSFDEHDDSDDEHDNEQQRENETSKDNNNNDDVENTNEESKDLNDSQSEAGEQSEDDDSNDSDSESDNYKEETVSNKKHNQDNFNYSPNYKAYTTKFDIIENARDIVDDTELNQLREKLDKILETYNTLISRIANRLQRKLQAQQLRSWKFDLEEGLLDSAKLTRVVTNPLQSLSFKQEDNSKFKDTVVTLLIDNSGSMRGRPISIAAMTSDILTRTLERCGVKVEVLGFTTLNWKGGQSFKQWEEKGRPENPGRLNDLRHIIYKSADENYNRNRKSFGLLLKEGLLKENIDGEALKWAFNRLKNRNEDRKILMVISDGAPVDDATLSHNQSNYLERNLRDMIDLIENNSKIDLIAIGIGHDVTRYYKNAVTIANAENLADVMMGELINLFDDNKK